MNERDFAVVIAINSYDASKEFRTLKGPTNDASEVIAWLKDPNGGGVPPNNIDPYIVLSDGNGERPTQTVIGGVLRDLLTRSRPVDQPIGRRLYVFLAGHGFTPSVTLSLLHSVETRRVAPTFISGTQWLDCFHEQALFDELVLWMDCCRDYEPNFDSPGRPCVNKVDAASNRVKRMFLLATGVGKGAYEKEFQGKVHGVFSRALLDALRDEAIDGNGRMTAANVVDVISSKLSPAAKAGLNIFPDPTLTLGFVLFEKLAPRSSRVRITGADPSWTVKVLTGDGAQPRKSFEPLSSDGGELLFELPRWRTYVAVATDSTGIVANMDFLVRGNPEPDPISLRP